MLSNNGMTEFALDPTEAYIIGVFRESTRAEQRKIFETAMEISLRREQCQRYKKAAQPKDKIIAFPVHH